MAQTTRKTATAAEALNEPITFDWRGEEYTAPATNQWPYSALEAIEDGRLTSFLRSILDKDQMDKFRATNPTVEDLGDFIEVMQKALGIAGN